jgi:hypothetical protein
MSKDKEVKSFAKLGKTLATVAALAIVAIGAGLLVAWYMGSHGSVSVTAPAETFAPSPSPAPGAPAVRPASPPPVERTIPDTAGDPQLLDSRTWEEKLEEILLRGGEPDEKADKILALIPTASPDAQVELSQHLINMAQDDHYDGVAGLLTNANTQKAVSTVLMNDLLNRKNTLKLPMLLAIAENDDHPLKGEAKDLLGVFIQTDYGTNWTQWSSAIDTWLQQNEQ